MSDVPSQVYREILLRLPADSLLSLRSVCKKWQRIIDDSSFIKSHTNNQFCSHTILVRDKSGSAPLYSFSLDSLNFINTPQMIAVTRIKQSIRRGSPILPPLFHVVSCNGLILVPNSDLKKVWAIFNPLTKDFHELPQCKAASTLYGLCGVGFGYDYVADDYKVVRIDKWLCGRKIVYQTFIYNLKSDSWRKIEDCPCCPCVPWLAAFLNGKLYWKSGDTIIALDLWTESYSQLPLPLPPVDRSKISKMIGFGYHLDSLDGCLICSLNYKETKTFDGWVMKDNGVEKSWIKLFSLQYFRHNVSGELRLVAYLKKKEQVVLQHNWGFLWFDIRNNSVLKFSIHGLPNITSSQICTGSLVRPNGHAIGVEALTKKRKRNTIRTDTRLHFCVRNIGEMCCSDNHYCSEDSCRHCKEVQFCKKSVDA